MDVWRIAKEKYALDKLGTGARIAGGRWNSVNVPMIYTGMTIEIASFEKLVHLSGELPDDLVLVKISIPDDILIMDGTDGLPSNWDAFPSSAEAQAFGNDFIQQGAFMAMVVPSVVIPEARNVLINPNHVDWGKCTMEILRAFSYDQRLGKTK